MNGAQQSRRWWQKETEGQCGGLYGAPRIFPVKMTVGGLERCKSEPVSPKQQESPHCRCQIPRHEGLLLHNSWSVRWPPARKTNTQKLHKKQTQTQKVAISKEWLFNKVNIWDHFVLLKKDQSFCDTSWVQLTQAPTGNPCPKRLKEPKYESLPDYGLHDATNTGGELPATGGGAEEDRAGVGFLKKGGGVGVEDWGPLQIS